MPDFDDKLRGKRASRPPPDVTSEPERGGRDAAQLAAEAAIQRLVEEPTRPPAWLDSEKARLQELLRRTGRRLPAAVGEKLAELASPEMLIGLTAWAASHALGIGEVIDAIMLAVGAACLGRDAITALDDLAAGIHGGLAAQSNREMDVAAEHLARAVSTIGVDALLVLATRKIHEEAQGDGTAEAAHESGGATDGPGGNDPGLGASDGSQKVAARSHENAAAVEDPRASVSVTTKRITVSPGRRTHILSGDATGGGHAPHATTPGKTRFPDGWSDEKIIGAIEQIANDPASYPEGRLPIPRKPTSMYKAVGVVGGVTIKVVVQPAGEGIITGHPL